MRSEDRYWAGLPVDELGTAVSERFDRYQRELGSSLRGRRIVQARARWVGVDADGSGTSSDLTFGGGQGETVIAQVNHFRSLVRSLRSIASSSRPAFDAVAMDDSAEAAAACELAEQVWEHELEQDLERVLGQSDERMLVEGEVAFLALWDPDAGATTGVEPLYERSPETGEVEVDPETGEPRPELDADGAPRERAIHEGAIVYEALGPHDVARDPEATDLHRLPWTIVRRRLHRWDLLANLNPSSRLWGAVRSAPGPGSPSGHDRMRDTQRTTLTDQVYALELYHERTAALPEGRYARVVGGEVLEEGPLPYESSPVILRSPSQEMGRAAGYTDAWDLMGLSRAIDMVVGDMISHSERFGQLAALIPEGADIDVSDLVAGGEVRYKWEQGMPPPQWMSPPSMGDGGFKLLEWLEKTLQVLSGVNSVVRGDPEASLKSGAALALVQAMAVQHASVFQGVSADLRRTAATKIVEVYRAFATQERLLALTGGHQAGTVRAFAGSDLKPVKRIRATLANPLLRTVAGKKEVIDDLTQRFPDEPPITRAQYLGFLETGRYEPVFRADEAQRRLVMVENDRFLKGEPVLGRLLDHHECHIREHNALLDGRARYEMREQAMAAIEAHILWHGQAWVETSMSNPALLAATNQRPAPMPMGPPMDGPPGGGGPGGPPPDASEQPDALGPPPDAQADGPIPGSGPPNMPSMPNMPVNPGTGERVPPMGGPMG